MKQKTERHTVFRLLNERTDQQLEEPETWFVVAGLEGVDEEKHHEAIKDERVDLHGEVGVVWVETGEDAETPQHAQETSDLQHREGKQKIHDIRRKFFWHIITVNRVIWMKQSRLL